MSVGVLIFHFAEKNMVVCFVCINMQLKIGACLVKKYVFSGEALLVQLVKLLGTGNSMVTL